MYKILSKRALNETVTEMTIEAPAVAARARAGQFVILRVCEEGERIPLTIAGVESARGGVKIIFQVVGATTARLNAKEAGESIPDFAGPLGRATDVAGISRALVIGGGVGCAIALPVARALREAGARVEAIIGFRERGLVILEDEFRAVCEQTLVVTDDGSYGERGNVVSPLRRYIAAGERFDRVFAVGPLVMMKFTVEALRGSGIPVTVSMNPIMIDGTGMCGGCRLSLLENGRRVTRFACVDGPDFDGYAVDFDEAMRRNRAYASFERAQREQTCRLLGG